MGEYSHTIDAKGRVILPADFRALLGKWETYAAASKETDNG